MKTMTNAVVQSGPAIRWFPAGFLALALFILVFALFSPSLRYDLVGIDDITYISNNTLVSNGLSPAAIRQAFSIHNVSATMYMPLLWISYMADVEWLGASASQPWGFHVTNVLLHSLNALLLYLLLLAWCKKPWRAFFFAALWALHPLRVESVAWVTERKDVLSGFFGLLCMVAYVWATTSRRSLNPVGQTKSHPSFLWLSAAGFFFLCGLLVKPALAPLPLVLLALDFWPLRRLDLSAPTAWRRTLPRLLVEKIPFLVLAGLAACGTVLGHHVVSGEIQMPILERLRAVPLNYGFYVYKTFLPFKLSVLYPPWHAWASPGWLAALALLASSLLAAFTWQAWTARRHSPHQTVGWFWFLAMLLPVCGLLPIPANDFADRFTYFPAMGMSVVLLFLLPSHPGLRGLWRWFRPILAGIVLAILCGLSWRQLPAWTNTTALFDRILNVFPRHATALQTQAGHLMRSTGNVQEANRLVDRALQADPNHWEALFAKAQCLAALDGPAAAQQLLLGIAPPTSRFTRSNWERDLARYGLMLGQYDDAIRHANQAMSRLPSQDVSRTPLLFIALTAAHQKGDLPLALSFAHQYPPYADKTSLELSDLLPHYIFQWIAGYRRDAVAFFQLLTRTYPDRPDLLNNLAWGLATAEWSPSDPNEVLDMARHLVAALPSPPHPGVLDTLAAAQANTGDFDSAIQTLQNALALFPSSPPPELELFRERLASRLALYEKGYPYREDAFSRLYVSSYGDMTRLNDPGTQ
jgi:tetratricopeptide (TPR) repeat protein